MTKDAFLKRIKSKDKRDDLYNYFLIAAILVMGLFFLYKSIMAYDEFNSVYIVPIILIGSSLYLIWRIKFDYVIDVIESRIESVKKREIILGVLKEYKIVSTIEENNYIVIKARNRFWNFFYLIAFIDNEKIFLNVKGADMGSTKGIIDFGFTYRIRKKIVKKIKYCL